MGTNYVFFDLETTGLDPRTDRVCEIGAIRIKQGKRAGTFSQLINPQMPISPGAFAANRITPEMLKGAPMMGQVMPYFINFVSGCKMLSYNAPFDLRFLSAELGRLGSALWVQPATCILIMARNLLPGLPGYSLGRVADALSIQLPVKHRALDDAEVALQVFNRLLSIMDQPVSPV